MVFDGFCSSQNEKCIWSNPSFDYVYGVFKNATLVCTIENLPLFYHQVPDTCPLANFLEMKVDCSPQYSSSVNGFLVGAYVYLWWRLLKIRVLIGNIYTRYQDCRQCGWTISLTLWEKYMLSAIEKMSGRKVFLLVKIFRREHWCCTFYHVTLEHGCRRCSNLMVSVPDSGLRGPGSKPGCINVTCSWTRHFTLTVPLFTQEYKWVLVNFPGSPLKCWWVTLQWTIILSMREW